jgi:hypothetical protein
MFYGKNDDKHWIWGHFPIFRETPLATPVPSHMGIALDTPILWRPNQRAAYGERVLAPVTLLRSLQWAQPIRATCGVSGPRLGGPPRRGARVIKIA